MRSRTEDAVRTEDATSPELEGKQEVALHIEGRPPLYFLISDPDAYPINGPPSSSKLLALADA